MRRLHWLVVAWLLFLAGPLRAEGTLQPVDLGQVQVAGELGRRIDATIANNLLQIDLEKDFLEPFRRRDQTGGYIGLGKLIDSMARLAAYSKDPELTARLERTVAATIATQEADGYIGLMKPEARLWTLWDIHEMGYLVYGLTTDYRLCGRAESLEAARKLADYIVQGWTAQPDRTIGDIPIATRVAVTGLEAALLALYDQTKDERYLRFVTDFRKLPEWDEPLSIGRWGGIEGHAYAYLSRSLAQLRLDRLQPDPRLRAPSARVLEFLTAGDGLVVTGACGDHECWHNTQAGTINLGETCATAYLLRWLDELLRREGHSAYGDLMERAVLNALFAAQSPDGRRLRYYSPFEGPRQYFAGDTYCCPCNYRRIVAELPQMVYYREAGGGIYVNLYTASEATIDLGQGRTCRLRQETDYPASGRVVLHVEPSAPARFALRLRVPRWCSAGTTTVNSDAARPLDGITQTENRPSAVVLDRTWQPGDRLTLDLAMPLRLVRGRQAQAGRVAVLRGPVVYTLARAGIAAQPPLSAEALARLDLRLLTIDPASLEGPLPSDALRPGGTVCRVKAWGPGQWYPYSPPDLELTLTEFPDPAGEQTYFNVPKPGDERFVADELVREWRMTKPE